MRIGTAKAVARLMSFAQITCSNLNLIFIVTLFKQFLCTKLENSVQLLLVERHCTVATHTDIEIHSHRHSGLSQFSG